LTDNGLPPANGARVYVRSVITNRHQLAKQLAIEHTKQEIVRLYNGAAGVAVGSSTLQQVFKLDVNALANNNVAYKQLLSKQN
jgi:hypothetical protein